jgi:hypothetical protein
MNCLPVLLASSSVARAAEGEKARQATAGVGWSFVTIALVVAALAMVAALGWLVRWYLIRRKRVSKNDPRKLLHELCRAHDLSGRAERLLRKAAAAMGTPHPARFFLEPHLLRQASQCKGLASSRRALQMLQEKLFGEESE